MSLKKLVKKIGSPKGFTFIELLIAIAIISIMVSIGAVSFTAAQRQGRDAQRKSDLGKVASALEQYYSDNNAYPVSISGQISCGSAIPWGDPFTCSSVIYLNELPADPSPTQNYTYEVTNVSGGSCTGTNCQRFNLATDLENDNDAARDPGCVPLYDYCVSNP